jgi:phosphoenolpyruvate-protein kinase (PTS system EI component)
MARRTSALLVAVALCAGLALSACGDDSSSLCKDVDSLKSSVKALGEVDVVENGTSELRSALDDVKSDTQALADEAKKDFGPEVDALQQALSTLDTALRNVADNGITPVKEARQAVQSSAKTLEDDITSQKCS